MKRWIACLLALCLVLMSVNGFAEEAQPEEKGLWGSTVDWFGQTWDEAAGWVDQLVNDAPEWMTEIWGDVSDWAGEAYGDIIKWWTEFSESLGETADSVKAWLEENLPRLREEWNDYYESVSEALAATGEDALATVREAFDKLVAFLPIAAEDAGKIWDTIKGYAEEKGISVLSAAKIALVDLMVFGINQVAAGEQELPSTAVAQFLLNLLNALDIRTDEEAEAYVEQILAIFAVE